MKRLLVYLVGVSALVLSSAAVAGAEKSEGVTKDLFEQRCSTCHTVSRPTSQKKTAREWERTVLRMKNVNGASITDQEAGVIIEYLVKNHGA